jgi:DNA-binding MarR family transcriptional regulator
VRVLGYNSTAEYWKSLTMDDEKTFRDLGLLEEIERDPDVTQAGMAAKLGVAVGTVNWHLKRLIAKGYVKVKRAERRKLRYIITPDGLALRAKLTVAYVENSLALYRRTRAQARKVLFEAKREGFSAVRIDGTGDIADICRLTCLEMGIEVSESQDGRAVGVLEVNGPDIRFIRKTNAEGLSDHTLKVDA